MSTARFRLINAAAMALITVIADPATAQTQEFPRKPIAIVVAFAAGSGTDTQARAGMKGFDVSDWLAVYGPASLPPAMTRRLNDMAVKAAGIEPE